jgi:hypothetical protein
VQVLQVIHLHLHPHHLLNLHHLHHLLNLLNPQDPHLNQDRYLIQVLAFLRLGLELVLVFGLRVEELVFLLVLQLVVEQEILFFEQQQLE